MASEWRLRDVMEMKLASQLGIWGYCMISWDFYKQQYVNVFEKYVVAVAE